MRVWPQKVIHQAILGNLLSSVQFLYVFNFQVSFLTQASMHHKNLSVNNMSNRKVLKQVQKQHESIAAIFAHNFSFKSVHCIQLSCLMISSVQIQTLWNKGLECHECYHDLNWERTSVHKISIEKIVFLLWGKTMLIKDV